MCEMKFYSKSGKYFWEIDRFKLFTESEKCGMLDALERVREIWNSIEAAHEEGGMIEMFDNLIKEVKKGLEEF